MDFLLAEVRGIEIKVEINPCEGQPKAMITYLENIKENTARLKQLYHRNDSELNKFSYGHTISS